MSTSKIIAEIIENQSEFDGCSNSCNKFVSIDLDKPYDSPVAPLSKGRGGSGPSYTPVPVWPVMDPASGDCCLVTSVSDAS